MTLSLPLRLLEYGIVENVQIVTSSATISYMIRLLKADSGHRHVSE